jgi:hypothetical protein
MNFCNVMSVTKVKRLVVNYGVLCETIELLHQSLESCCLILLKTLMAHIYLNKYHGSK